MNLEQAKSFAEKHFRLNAPLSEATVASFETEHKVILPAEYRDFLLKAGNGGQSRTVFPRHLFRLGEEIKYHTTLSGLNRIFPYTQAQTEFSSDLCNVPGIMPLVHEGCGYHHMLVITGQERGNVWVADFSDCESLVPLYSEIDNKRVGFFDWFAWWDAYVMRTR